MKNKHRTIKHLFSSINLEKKIREVKQSFNSGRGAVKVKSHM